MWETKKLYTHYSPQLKTYDNNSQEYLMRTIQVFIIIYEIIYILMSNEQKVCLAKQLVMGSQSPERLRRFWHKVIFHIQISNICTLTGWKAHALLSRSSVMLDTVMSDTASSHGNANLQVFFFFFFRICHVLVCHTHDT